AWRDGQDALGQVDVGHIESDDGPWRQPAHVERDVFATTIRSDHNEAWEQLLMPLLFQGKGGFVSGVDLEVVGLYGKRTLSAVRLCQERQVFAREFYRAGGYEPF